MEDFTLHQPEVKNMVSILGFSMTGQGQNVGLSFLVLKDWSERNGAEHSANSLAKRITGAPPSITLTIAYPGADAQTIEDTVLSRIEREMNGLENLDYMEAKSLSNGTGTLTLTFYPGTDDDIAQMNVQNALSRAEPRLPAMVKQTGVQIAKSRSNFLMVTMYTSDNPNLTPADMADYVARNIQPELQRIDGVGNVMVFGSERAISGARMHAEIGRAHV